LHVSGVPPQSEPPEIIQWVRWVAGYFAREGKVLWQAKVTFGATALALVTASVWATWKASGTFYEERIAAQTATIKYLESQLARKDSDASEPSKASSPNKEPSKPQAPSAHIVVTKFELLPINPSEANSNLTWKVHFINHGPSIGYAPRMLLVARVLDTAPSATEIDKQMVDVVAEAGKPSRDQQVEVNQDYWVDVGASGVSPDELSLIRSGKKKLFVWIVLTFFDADSDKNYWISEYCGSPEPGFNSIRICQQKTYLHPQ
jgi:hypothetical protein